MNTPSPAPVPPVAAEPAAPAPPPAPAPDPSPSPPPARPDGRLWQAVAAVAAVLAVSALALAWSGRQRVQTLEGELVRRQQASAEQATDARLLARQAQELTRDTAAKMALLEARVAESAVQRSQVEDLMQSIARSRDENVLADIEAALRVALQHSAITGSTEPLLAALQQADERLARHSQPPLERVRRAIAKDIERTRDVGVADIAALTLRLDEAIRAVDDLPLLSRPDRQPAAVRPTEVARPPAASASANAVAAEGDVSPWRALWQAWGVQVWQEVRSLVRVTRIDQPDAMLVAPEQAWFLRENLKLRLLNARLALLSRQFDTAQSDLRDARTALERYFDRNARGVQGVANTLRQVMAQARQVGVPRPDATLAAIAAAAAGR
ncbi:MAG: uroporphyrinogen-III C-methyltransferase [Burkholderiaceae bacterium]|nr:uroporphyrinogen-III C-methyltransferase [Burkholderiaceae bacterium]